MKWDFSAVILNSFIVNRKRFGTGDIMDKVTNIQMHLCLCTHVKRFYHEVVMAEEFVKVDKKAIQPL